MITGVLWTGSGVVYKNRTEPFSYPHPVQVQAHTQCRNNIVIAIVLHLYLNSSAWYRTWVMTKKMMLIQIRVRVWLCHVKEILCGRIRVELFVRLFCGHRSGWFTHSKNYWHATPDLIILCGETGERYGKDTSLYCSNDDVKWKHVQHMNCIFGSSTCNLFE